MPLPTRASLSPGRAALLRLMQRTNFGRIEGLVVRRGEPVLRDPAPRVILDVKFGGENGPRPEADSPADYALKPQVVDLFRRLDELGDGTVGVLTVRHGLPFNMAVEVPHE